MGVSSLEYTEVQEHLHGPCEAQGQELAQQADGASPGWKPALGLRLWGQLLCSQKPRSKA